MPSPDAENSFKKAPSSSLDSKTMGCMSFSCKKRPTTCEIVLNSLTNLELSANQLNKAVHLQVKELIAVGVQAGIQKSGNIHADVSHLKTELWVKKAINPCRVSESTICEEVRIDQMQSAAAEELMRPEKIWSICCEMNPFRWNRTHPVKAAKVTSAWTNHMLMVYNKKKKAETVRCIKKKQRSYFFAGLSIHGLLPFPQQDDIFHIF